MKILVTGANGQLGSELKSIVAQSPEYTFVDVEQMDLSKEESINAFFYNREFQFVIHCAAYTAVDQAENDRDTALCINGDAVKRIATLCKERNMRMIYISTDYVFDGNGNEPIRVDAKPNPLSVYGESKLKGEQHVQQLLDNAYIIRTAWVYSYFGKNFVKTISKLARERDTLGVIYDQVGSPTNARDLAHVILQIIDKINSGSVDQPGTYHYTNEGVISWYDLAHFIVDHYGLKCKIKPITTADYITLAVRPKYSVLDKSKLKETFGIEIPHWH
ncbi:MAG: dTDP-4-dehydrorhamnose reductase, partial [Chryseolinea sp.]